MEIELRNLYFKYEHNQREIINGLSLKINKGERIVVLGENGMGKSTLFLLANGILKAQKGNIYINHKLINVNSHDIYRLRQTVGLVFQNPDVQFIAPTVEEEISFAALNRGLSTEDTKLLMDRISKMLDIQDLMPLALHTLSGGQKKLVSIASVLSLEPEFIFFDEPSAGLDYRNSQKLIYTLNKLHKKNYGLVVSTHDIDFAWEWADRIIILNEGKIAADGSVLEVLTDKRIIEQQGLRLPYIYQFMDMSSISIKDVFPRTMEELKLLRKDC